MAIKEGERESFRRRRKIDVVGGKKRRKR